MAVQMPAQRVVVRRAAQMDVLIAARNPALKADRTTVMRVRVAVNVRQKVAPRSVVKSALPMSYAQKARAMKPVNRASHVKFVNHANHANHEQMATAKVAVQSVHDANAMIAVTKANG